MGLAALECPSDGSCSSCFDACTTCVLIDGMCKLVGIFSFLCCLYGPYFADYVYSFSRSLKKVGGAETLISAKLYLINILMDLEL